MLKVKLLSNTPDPSKVVASAAKLCYSPVGVDDILEKQTEESIEGFISNLAEIKHLSPFEHASFTFAIEGVSRTLTHQLVRHRIASYSQQSQRYVKEDSFQYIIPPAINNVPAAKDIFIDQMKSSQKAYDDIVNNLMFRGLCESDKSQQWFELVHKHTDFNGVDSIQETESLMQDENNLSLMTSFFDIFKSNFKKEYSSIEKRAIEDARYVFPNATETKIVITMNARSLINFFSLRCCNRAQWEIRNMADKMLKEVIKVAPALFANSGAPCTFGVCTEGTMTCGKPRSLEDIVGNK